MTEGGGSDRREGSRLAAGLCLPRDHCVRFPDRGLRRRFVPGIRWRLSPKAPSASTFSPCVYVFLRHSESTAFEQAPTNGWHFGQYILRGRRRVSSSGCKKSHRLSVEAGARVIRTGTDLYRRGDICSTYFIVLSGWIALSVLLDDGSCQILDFALPGAILGFQQAPDAPMYHSARCLSVVRVYPFPRRKLDIISAPAKPAKSRECKSLTVKVQRTTLAPSHASTSAKVRAKR